MCIRLLPNELNYLKRHSERRVSALVEYWSNFFVFLWETFSPINIRITVQYMMMMVIALHFNGNGNRFENCFRMIMRMMFDRNMDSNSVMENAHYRFEWMILIECGRNVVWFVNGIASFDECATFFYRTYLDELAIALFTNTATNTTVTAKHHSICNEYNFIYFIISHMNGPKQFNPFVTPNFIAFGNFDEYFLCITYVSIDKCHVSIRSWFSLFRNLLLYSNS